MKASLRCIVVFLTLGLFAATLAPAADLVLKGATAWKKDYVFNDGYWEFTRQVEKLSGGKIKVDWKGGPEIAPAFEMLSLVQRGVVDVLGSSAAYYTDKYMEGVFPEYFVGTPAVMRNAGITKFFDDLSQKKTAVKLLGMTSGPVGIAIFTKKPVKGIADFKGLKMRSTPTYLPMGQALGASMIRIPWADLYPALERGVVEGYFSPAIGTLQTKLYEQVCCMLKPYFWTVRTWMYINLDVWKKLTPEQQKVLKDSMVATEGWTPGFFKGFIADEINTLVSKHGLKIVELKGDEAKRFRTMAYESSWKKYLPNSPEYGKQIREMARKLEDR
jgi:TRAP-type C4-dicarboxylate transport system substrate-binding protein